MSGPPHGIVIAFDCGGIFANDIPVDMFKQLAVECYPESERSRIADIHARNRDLWNKFKVEEGYSEQKYFETVIEREKLNESVDELKRRLRESVVCYEHAREVAVKLHQKGYLLAIMSNHSIEWFKYISDRFQFEDFVPASRTIVSQAVNAAKPTKEIMEKLEMAIKNDVPAFQRDQCVFVDDTQANVEAAQNFGFRAFLFDSRKQTQQELWDMLSNYGITQ